MTDNFISDTSLRGEISGRVRDLTGFSRNHREPDEHSLRVSGYIQRTGSQDVAERAEQMFARIRKGFRYKRKEITLVRDEGCASIETPDFNVALTLDQHPAAPENYRLTTEVNHFRRPEVVNQAAFLDIFSSCCDRVILHFAQPMDLEAKIDEIEEDDDLAECLDYDAACSWLTLRLAHLTVEVTAIQMACNLSGQGSLADLITQTQTALARLYPAP